MDPFFFQHHKIGKSTFACEIKLNSKGAKLRWTVFGDSALAESEELDQNNLQGEVLLVDLEFDHKGKLWLIFFYNRVYMDHDLYGKATKEELAFFKTLGHRSLCAALKLLKFSRGLSSKSLVWLDAAGGKVDEEESRKTGYRQWQPRNKLKAFYESIGFRSTGANPLEMKATIKKIFTHCS